jgi:outer membrane protein assembly factor BamB
MDVTAQTGRRQAVIRLFGVFAALLAALASGVSRAGDWPQILGPHRTGVAVDERIISSFPSAGPAILWEHPVGEGFAGVAVSDGTLVVFHRIGNEEVVEALDALSSSPKWSRKYPATFAGGYSQDHGPRCVPLIDHGSVYLYGATGDLHCLDLKSGKDRWSRAVGREFEAPDGFFGVGSTPIVEDENLLVNVGGKKGSGIVAFRLTDGKPVWQVSDEKASYSSPTAATIDGVRHVIFVTRLAALSIDPATGKVRWQFPFGDRGPTVNAATPQVIDGHLFLSASYGIGAVCRKIGTTSADEVWADNDTMSSQFSTAVPFDGLFYGVDGRVDIPPARLRCFDPRTGKVRWTKEGFPVSNLIVADGKLVIVTDDGMLVLVAPSAKSYSELARARIFRTTTRALPALASGRLYVRDTATLKCVDLHATR